MRDIQFRIIEEIIKDEPKSVYNIAQSLNSDYGNTNRNTRELLNMDYIRIAEKKKGKTNNETILYDATSKGVIIHMLYYMDKNNLYPAKKTEFELNIHYEYISRIFLKYPDYFPILSNNLKHLLSYEFDKNEIYPVNISFYAFYLASKNYLLESKLREERFSKNIASKDVSMEEDHSSQINPPPELSLEEIYEEQFIKGFILEPPAEFVRKGMDVSLFLYRLYEIYNVSEDLKIMIQDYFEKKGNYYQNYADYYNQLSGANVEM